MSTVYSIGDVPYSVQNKAVISLNTQRYLTGKSWAVPSKMQLENFDKAPLSYISLRAKADLLGLKSGHLTNLLLSSPVIRGHITQKAQNESPWFPPIPHDSFDVFFWITMSGAAVFDSFVKTITLVVSHEAILKIRDGAMLKFLDEWAQVPIALQLIRSGFHPMFQEFPILKRLDASLLEKHLELIRQLVLGLLPEPFYERLIKRNVVLSSIRKRSLETLDMDGELFLIICDRIAQDLEGWRNASD